MSDVEWMWRLFVLAIAAIVLVVAFARLLGMW